MSPSVNIALREMRGGIRQFRVFLACLMLGIAAIAAVGSVRAAIEAGLASEGATILGGDAEMEFTYRYATPEERAWMEDRAEAVGEIVDFRSMAVIERDGKTERALVQVKAVDDIYPIYGQVMMEPAMPLGDALGADGIIAEQTLLDRLGLAVGDEFLMGNKSFRVSSILRREPDTAASGFNFGPRVIVHRDALNGAGLVTEGTLFDTEYKLRLPPGADLAALETEAEDAFRDSGMRWRDSRNGSPGTQRFVERMGSFLVIVGLAGLAVGGIGVAAAVRAFLEGKIETIATLKTLGATGSTIFTVYFIQIGAIAVLGILAGLAVGGALPLVVGPLVQSALPLPARFAVYPGPLLEAGLYGLLSATIFTLWPMARARDIRAAGLFRDIADRTNTLPRWPYIAITAVLAALFIGAAAFLSGIPTLTLWSAAGLIGAMLVLALAALATSRVSRTLSSAALARGRTALRLALGSIGGPSGETRAVVLSLGLGLTVLATIGQIDSNLRGVISGELPEIAPAYFVVDIQRNQRDGFLDAAQAAGAEEINTAPMLRGILTRINGQPARDVAGEHWVLMGDRGVTYGDAPPDGAIITEGAWWQSGYDGPPVVSFAEEEGREMGLTLGDRITVNILGRDIEAEIVNFRVVDFGNMGINFLMMMNESALSAAPHTHIATVYAPLETEGPLLRKLADTYPNITAIRTRDAIARASDTVRALASATSWSAIATLVTGFAVLIGAAAAGERRRTYEAAILKTIGASRSTILTSFALRSAILGAAAGIVAVFAAILAGWAVLTFVMDASYRVEWISAIAIVVGGAIVNLLASLAFVWRPLAARPARILRTQD